MVDGSDEKAGATEPPALQVICLGSGGGPSEDNVTGLLVRSTASDWARGSLLAVDAGAHLAPIIRILERDFPTVSGRNSKGYGVKKAVTSTAQDLEGRAALSPSPAASSPPEEETKGPEPTTLSSGPFAGLRFPNTSARANALHVIRNYVSTYLITHPHLDHLSGFAINTAAFHATSRPKTLAALPSTVDAVKQHIFNDIIWPNLTDEDGGVGFVTFQRLKEGGDVMVGTGEGRGYIDVSDRLGVRAFKVSHGVCTKSPPSHQHRNSIHALPEAAPTYHGHLHGETTQPMARSHSQVSAPGTPGVAPRGSFYSSSHPSPRMGGATACVVDSSAFLIREEETNREVLIFGDVEPDSLSLHPRNHVVWSEAARKVALGTLRGIFIECSYDDSQADAVLFGHLNPRHLIAELQTLAGLVAQERDARSAEAAARRLHKRKRSLGEPSAHARSRSLIGRSMERDVRRGSLPEYRAGMEGDSQQQQQNHQQPHPPRSDADEALMARIQSEHIAQQQPAIGPSATHEDDAISPRTTRAAPVSLAAVLNHNHDTATAASPESGTARTSPSSRRSPTLPLHGVKVVVIHVKDTLQDGPHVAERILTQLEDYARGLEEQGRGLGCEFVVAEQGESYWF